MEAGYRPYRTYEHNASLLDNAIRRQEPREPLPPHIEPALVAIVHKLLAPQVERRYQRADAILHDLEAFLESRPTTAGLEHAQASQETVRLARHEPTQDVPTMPMRPAVTQTAPTEPLVHHPPATAASAATQPAAGLAVAGQPDAGTAVDAATQSAAMWRPPLPMMLKPEAMMLLPITLSAREGVSLNRRPSGCPARNSGKLPYRTSLAFKSHTRLSYIWTVNLLGLTIQTGFPSRRPQITFVWRHILNVKTPRNLFPGYSTRMLCVLGFSSFPQPLNRMIRLPSK